MTIHPTIHPIISEYINDNPEKPFYSTSYYTGNGQITDIIRTNDFQTMLTATIRQLYGEYRLRRLYFGYGDNKDIVIYTDILKQDVMTVYARNKYKYDKLYETTILEYNPLDNVDETDHWEEQHTGKDVTTENVGSKTTQEKIGNRSDSATYGSRTDTNTYEKAPYESSNYQAKDRNTITNGGHTDSAVIGEQNNQIIESGQENTDTLQHGHIITYDRRRHGNIGITSAMQLLTAQREVANFSFVDIVARDIMQQIAIGVLN